MNYFLHSSTKLQHPIPSKKNTSLLAALCSSFVHYLQMFVMSIIGKQQMNGVVVAFILCCKILSWHIQSISWETLLPRRKSVSHQWRHGLKHSFKIILGEIMVFLWEIITQSLKRNVQLSPLMWHYSDSAAIGMKGTKICFCETSR